MKLKDIRGVELEPGQAVAFADIDGHVASLRIGIIEEILDAHGKVTIRWDNQRWGPAVSTVSISGAYVDRPRIAVVEFPH